MRSRLSLCLGVFLLAIGISTILINAQYSDPAAPTREYYRPLIGGIQYYADKGICTLSYAARDSTGRVGMVTARHCASQSSPLYQPDDSSISYYIGTPAIWTYDIDAMFVRFSNSVPYVLHINNFYGTYYPTKWNVYDYVPVQDIRYFYGVPVFKTGRTTGTTQGTIDRVYYTYIIGANLHAEQGDSGSPLYAISPHGDGALLFGHLIGGSSDYTLYISVSGVINYLGIKPLTYP
jgi:hypothetical protein